MDTISSDDLNSDNEFWQTFESKTEKPESTIQIKKQKTNSILLTSEKERLLKTIVNIRDSKEVELQSLQIRLENSSKRELLKKISTLKDQFVRDTKSLYIIIKDLKSTLLLKEKQISDLTNLLITQELLISDMRNSLVVPSSPKHPQVKLPQDNILKTQLDLYKNLTEELTEEVQNLTQKITYLKEENSKQKSSFSKPEELLKIKQEKIDLKQELDRFKQEVEIREIINERQIQSISLLQEEIKQIKTSTPKAESRLYENKKSEQEDFLNNLSLPNPRAKSLPKCSYSKIQNKPTIKEYKVFQVEFNKNQSINSPSPSRLDQLKNRSIVPSRKASRQKYFNSFLITNK